MNKKLACECKHTYSDHPANEGRVCAVPLCGCSEYDPAGHNPELENVLCPRCRLLRLERFDKRTYVCIACNYIMLEKQVKELVG